MTPATYVMLTALGIVLFVALCYAGVAAIAKALFDSPPTRKPRDDYGEGDS